MRNNSPEVRRESRNRQSNNNLQRSTGGWLWDSERCKAKKI